MSRRSIAVFANKAHVAREGRPLSAPPGGNAALH